MKTLFIKDNVPHIRLKEGEYEVINPEIITCLHIRHMPDGDWRIKTPDSGWTGEDVKWPVEWTYGVELIYQIRASLGYEDCSEELYNTFPDVSRRIVARLLPEEKKSESAYKEMEKPDFEALVKNISTEDWDYDLAIAGTSPSGRFSCGKDDVIELLEHIWNTHVIPLQRELDNEIKIREEYFEDAQLLLEDKRILQSENKALQEKLKVSDHLKELADDAIVTLQKEIERLKSSQNFAIAESKQLREEKVNLKKENKELREEIERLKAEQKAPSEHVLSGTMTPTPEDKRMFK